MGPRWPLIGRATELRAIERASRRAEGPRGVVLAGAAGVGKTRLAQEALTSVRVSGAATVWVTGAASTQALPLGSFATFLRSVGEDPLRAIGEATQALLAGRGPGDLVVVDDAHLLDEASAILVHQIVVDSPVTVVLTIRTGEPAPPAVTAIWKDGHLTRLDVGPLSRSETEDLLVNVLGGPMEGASLGRIWELVSGNALYLRELVAGEIAAERLHPHHGVWRWSGDPALSPGLLELIETRMGRLTDSTRDVVDILAYAGHLGVSTLSQLTDAAVVEQAESQGLIVVELDGRRLQARLAHPLYGEVRRARTGLLRARRLRGRIGLALARSGGRRADDDMRRAVFVIDSDLDHDAALLARAARRAAELQDLALAVRLAKTSVVAGGGFDAQSVVVHALSLMGNGKEAASELDVLAGLARTAEHDARIAIVRAANLFWTLKEPATAEAVVADALARATDEHARRELLAMRGSFHGFLGRPGAALRDTATALASPALGEQGVVLATWGRLIALGVTGRVDQTVEMLPRAYTATRSFSSAILRFPLAAIEIISLRLAGYLDRAAAVAQRCHDEAADAGSLPQSLAAALLGHTEAIQGRVDSAVRWLRLARTGFSLTDPGGWVFMSQLWLTEALALTGDAKAAQQAQEDLRTAYHGSFVWQQADVILAGAWVSAAQGALSEATASARLAAETAATAGLYGYEVLALQTAARFGDRTVAGRLAELVDHVDGPRVRAAAAHAKALAEDDAAALRAVCTELTRMGDLLAAADVAAQAAVVNSRRGLTQAARLDAARAQGLARSGGPARTPALAAAARPLPVTPREREIAALAAAGLSNREIAERLVVSVRTVEGHLYRLSTKLGITRRAELDDFFGGGVDHSEK